MLVSSSVPRFEPRQTVVKSKSNLCTWQPLPPTRILGQVPKKSLPWNVDALLVAERHHSGGSVHRVTCQATTTSSAASEIVAISKAIYWCYDISSIFQWRSITLTLTSAVPDIACPVYIGKKKYIARSNETSFIKGKCCHITLCLRQKIWSSYVWGLIQTPALPGYLNKLILVEKVLYRKDSSEASCCRRFRRRPCRCGSRALEWLKQIFFWTSSRIGLKSQELRPWQVSNKDVLR